VLRHDEVHLREAGTVERSALQVTEGAGRRRRKCGRVEENDAAAREERIDAGNEVRAPDVTRIAAARLILSATC